MLPQRTWNAGDEYWALWIRAEDRRYFPMFEGRVVAVKGHVIELSSGSWRYVDEGLAFASLAAARSFVVAHPYAPRSPYRDGDDGVDSAETPG
jgi:hypothetical protein